MEPSLEADLATLKGVGPALSVTLQKLGLHRVEDLLFLLPLCVFLGWKSFDFVAQSWALREASRESGGLPYPFYPLLKTVLLLMPITVSLQGLSLFLASLKKVRGR